MYSVTNSRGLIFNIVAFMLSTKGLLFSALYYLEAMRTPYARKIASDLKRSTNLELILKTLICINSSLMVKKPTSIKAVTGRQFEDDVWVLFASANAHKPAFEIGSIHSKPFGFCYFCSGESIKIWCLVIACFFQKCHVVHGVRNADANPKRATYAFI